MNTEPNEFLPNQDVIIEKGRIISKQSNSTPGVYKKFNVIPGLHYEVTLKGYEKGNCTPQLWVANDKKKTSFLRDVKDEERLVVSFDTRKVIVGMIFTDTKRGDYFMLENISLKLLCSACISICTYDRYNLLKNLLDSIQTELNKFSDLDLTIYIWDDGSPKPQIYNENDYNYKINYYKAEKNHGKLNWWKLHDVILEKMKDANHNFYYYMADDMVLVHKFFYKSIYHWMQLKDEKKIAMNLNNDRGSVRQWVNFEPKPVNKDVYITNWVDMCFLCERNFFVQLRYKLHDFLNFKRPVTSSGVGRYISLTLFQKGFKMYLIKSSLVQHMGNKLSKMNTVERKENPLISRF